MLASTNYSPQSRTELLIDCLVDGLKAELFLSPKPGLVDLLNNGSHSDLNPLLMMQSIVLMRDYLHDLCRSVESGGQWPDFMRYGKVAEQRMLDSIGSNAHKGGIFLCGLMLISIANCHQPEEIKALRSSISEQAELFFQARDDLPSHGRRVRQQFPRAGIIAEALSGLPALFELALPALEQDEVSYERRPFLAMARLMQHVEDSTSLHRCGPEGLRRLKDAGRKLERVLLSGDDPFPWLTRIDQQFISRRLTMGGVADLLGLACGYNRFRCLLLM